MNATSVLTLLFNKGIRVSTDNDELVIDAPKGQLQAEDVAMIREHRDDIVELLHQVQLEREPIVEVRRCDHSGRAALSAVQQSVLLMEHMAGDRAYGNIPAAFRIEGPLDCDALTSSLNALIATHEILRTTYFFAGDDACQIIHGAAPLQLWFEDISRARNTDEALQSALRAQESIRFDLSRDWPIRVGLIRLGEQLHVLSLVFHQIAMDGHSCQLFLKFLADKYADQPLEIRGPANSAECFQYADFADWQRRFQQSETYQESVRYWKNALTGAPELHSLPTDFLRPASQTFAGKTLETQLQANEYLHIEQAARSQETSVFTLMQAVFSLLIARYSGESDIVVGTAVANRTCKEFFSTLGNLVNTVVLRFQVDESLRFTQWLAQVKQTIDGAMRHQQVPFDVIVDQVRPARSVAHNPLVQLMLVIQEEEQSQLHLARTQITPLFRDPHIAKFDLALHVYKEESGAVLRWEFSTSLFREDTVARIAQHFHELLRLCIDNPESALGTLALSADCAAVILSDESLPSPECVDVLIDRQVRATPERIAVRAGMQTLTFAQLEEKAAHVAAHLQSRRASHQGKEFRVGVQMAKTPLLVIAFYAALKAGAVYVPLDPSYPQSRRKFMIADSEVDFILTDGPTEMSEVTALDIRALLSADAPSTTVGPRDPATSAYIIYTSGSTGKPKGVLVSHQSLFYSLHANRSVTRFSNDDIVPCLGSQAFGIALLEILLPLVSGGSVRMLLREHILDLDRLIDETQDSSVLHAVPSLMVKWLERVIERGSEYPALRQLLVGGESVPDELLRKLRQWRSGVELIELYGMTESAVVCSSYRPDEHYAAHYCIGRPHPTARFYVLNPKLQIQPQGVPGELHIGGPCLASGYLNQPELTAQKFIQNPFLRDERLYKTGDRVRMLPDGQYEFLGRIDHQVSLRGVRIECGEIEALLVQHPAIKKAVAHVITLGEGEKTLVGYYMTHQPPDDVAALNDSLREHLSMELPDYMRPALFQYLEEFPLNPNGKIDRKSLPTPQRVHRQSLPRTETERTLCELWQSLLGLEIVSVDVSFFELGGNSLLATKLITQAKKRFEVELPVTALFSSPTIRGLAEVIDGRLRIEQFEALIYESEGEAMRENELVL